MRADGSLLRILVIGSIARGTQRLNCSNARLHGPADGPSTPRTRPSCDLCGEAADRRRTGAQRQSHKQTRRCAQVGREEIIMSHFEVQTYRTPTSRARRRSPGAQSAASRFGALLHTRARKVHARGPSANASLCRRQPRHTPPLAPARAAAAPGREACRNEAGWISACFPPVVSPRPLLNPLDKRDRVTYI